MNRIRKKIFFQTKMVAIAAWMYLIFPISVYAANEPKIVTGTRSLISTGIGILTALVVSVITFNGLKVGMKWINSSPEERPQHQKELINVIIAGVVTLTIGGTIAWIVGFYQG